MVMGNGCYLVFAAIASFQFLTEHAGGTLEVIGTVGIDEDDPSTYSVWKEETYHVIEGPFTWRDASFTCSESMNMFNYELAASYDEFKYRLLRDAVNSGYTFEVNPISSVWFGAVKKANSPRWLLTGSCDVLPDTVNGSLQDTQQCASLVIDKATFYLQARDCKDLLPFVCVKRAVTNCYLEQHPEYSFDVLQAQSYDVILSNATFCSCTSYNCLGYQKNLTENKCYRLLTGDAFPNSPVPVTLISNTKSDMAIKKCKQVVANNMTIIQGCGEPTCVPTSTSSGVSCLQPTSTTSLVTTATETMTTSSYTTISTTNKVTSVTSTATITYQTPTTASPETSASTTQSVPLQSTSSPVQSPATTTTSADDTLCVCYNCSLVTGDAIQSIIKTLEEILTIDESTTSASRRKLTSADDPRFSAAMVGSSAIVVMVTILSVIMLNDVISLMCWLKGIRNATTNKKLAHNKRRSSNVFKK